MVKDLELKSEVKQGKITFTSIPVFKYDRYLQKEIDEGVLSRKKCLELLEQMLMIRAFEEMLVELISGKYSPLPEYKYVGPTHLSIGQEAVSSGAIAAIGLEDYITSSHRGHGDSMAKGYWAVKYMKDEDLKEFLAKREKYISAIGEQVDFNKDRKVLEEIALKVHIYRMIAELFGKTDGNCRGVGGGMHIADFSIGHLGANAIVGGHMGIAAGAAISCRFQKNNRIVLCLAGDGAYSNGIAHESMNLSTMAQFDNGLMGNKFGVPIIFAIVNNQYAMSGQERGEITGLDYLARRGASYNLNNMNAEVIDGMDVLAVYDAVRRSAAIARDGKAPVLLEFITYRYKGHSLSDPLSYRSREELKNWEDRDPISVLINKLTDAVFPEDEGKKISVEEISGLKEKVYKRNNEMAIKAAASQDPSPASLTEHIYADETGNGKIKSGKFTKPDKEIQVNPIPTFKRNEKGEISYRFAIREALIEEMAGNGKVVLFGEDVADYGGAFGVTNDLLSIFGRERVFNTSISESGIIGSAIGMSMTGMYPVAEIMYNDFILQAMDQIGNQAAKWSYMSGGQISLPLLIRTTIGGGKGYAGQHSQSLEAIAAHMPGLTVIAPSNPFDAKGLIKTSINTNNPVIFFEHQLLYNTLGVVPQDEFFVPIGKAKVIKEGSDITIISWSYMISEALKAASLLSEQGISAEIIDARTLVPLDIETIIKSVQKTNKAAICSQEVACGSYASEVSCRIQELAFDYLDAPIIKICAPDSVPPTSQVLEKIFLPNAEKISAAVKKLF